MADLHNNENKGWEFKWTDYEDNIIKEYYPQNGYEKVLEILPNRNKKGVQQRAHKIGVRYLNYNIEYFDIIDSPSKAYWLGFLYADGYVTTDNRWGLELSSVDIKHMTNLLNDINCNINIKTRIRNTNESCSFQIKNKHMYDSLVKNGVTRNKTDNLTFPPETILPRSLQNHFIRGFFDGDGCITYTTNTYKRKDRNYKEYNNLRKELSIVCKSKSFIDSILSVLKSNGVILNYTLNNRDNLHTIQVANTKMIIMFFNYIYNNSTDLIRLERKYSKFTNLVSMLSREVMQ